MKNPVLIKSNLVLVTIFLFSSNIISQNCKVEKKLIQGTYSGQCKNGKAEGQGKAIGTDTYEGEFKAGLPDGFGTYTWANGDAYTGDFLKGLRSGIGTFTYKKADGSDSIESGFWKKDAYLGKYANPYKIDYISEGVVDVSIQFRKDIFNRVTFWVTNTTGGTPSGNTSANVGSGVATGNTSTGPSTTSGLLQNPRLTVDNITMAPGGYQRMEQNSDHAKKTETIYYNVWYPAHMKVNIGPEMLELELLEAGSYIIDVRINR